MCHSPHFFFLEGVGENQNILDRDEAFEASDGLIEQGGVIEKIEELFRFGISAERPESGPASSG